MENGPLKKVYLFSFWIGSETDLPGTKRVKRSQYKILQGKFYRGFSHRTVTVMWMQSRTDTVRATLDFEHYYILLSKVCDRPNSLEI